MIDLFIKDELEAAAGVRQPLVAYAATNPNVKVFWLYCSLVLSPVGWPDKS